MGLDNQSIQFLLKNACLNEITPNFYRIYWLQNQKVITVYFCLEKKDDNDIETIEFEIMSLFELWVGDRLDASNLPNLYEIQSVIVIGKEQKNHHYYLDSVNEIYFKNSKTNIRTGAYDAPY